MSGLKKKKKHILTGLMADYTLEKKVLVTVKAQQ